MRVAVVAETFHPAVNRVSGSVDRVLEYLHRTGHQTLVIAPEPGADSRLGARVVRAPSFRPPVYRSLHIGRSSTPLTPVLDDFGADVVHLASPALRGLAGARAAAELGVPAVAVFQTDLAGFAVRYHLPVGPYVWRHLTALHGLCALTLAPSSASIRALARHGIGPVRLYPPRGHGHVQPGAPQLPGPAGAGGGRHAPGRVRRPAGPGEAAAPAGPADQAASRAGRDRRRRPLPHLSSSLLWRGLLAIAVGIVSVVWPGITVGAFVILFAVYAILAAGTDVARAFSRQSRQC